MMYSKRFNNYKFPGGGIDPDESHHDALKRELLEETGFRIATINEPLGCIIERNPDKFQTDTLFEMTSYYFRCAVQGEQTSPALTDSKTALGLECRWVALQDAVTANKTAADASDTPFWNTRETWMLEYLILSIPQFN
jgi:8-oxo-dGTP pyrophosphatase MutT (NUDIX family)